MIWRPGISHIGPLSLVDSLNKYVGALVILAMSLSACLCLVRLSNRDSIYSFRCSTGRVYTVPEANIRALPEGSFPMPLAISWLVLEFAQLPIRATRHVVGTRKNGQLKGGTLPNSAHAC